MRYASDFELLTYAEVCSVFKASQALNFIFYLHLFAVGCSIFLNF